ncbi:hypothetical protein DFS34DRAFT_618035 [Phlyctochytrium arcticum]|nr:hypothetical protein DFS34DRAFT_618035 [Phlyctochytrium arcticum]
MAHLLRPTLRTFSIARVSIARNLLVSTSTRRGYHHSQNIKVPPVTVTSNVESIIPPTNPAVNSPVLPKDANHNLFPHMLSPEQASSQAAGSSTLAREKADAQSKNVVSNESSTTVEELFNRPADEIRAAAGCSESSAPEASSSDSAARIRTAFESEAYPATSSSARGPRSPGLKESEFSKGSVADMSDSADTDPRTVQSMRQQMDEMAGGGVRNPGNTSGIPDGGVKGVQPFGNNTPSSSSSSSGRKSRWSEKSTETATKPPRDDETTPRHFAKQARKARVVMPSGTTEVARMGRD